MRLEAAKDLADVVRRACPNQTISDEVVGRWPGILTGLTFSECLVAVASLAMEQREIQAPDIQRRALLIRGRRQEPSGEAWEARRRRHGGREFPGGAVCWDPAVKCEGICRECPRELAGGAS